MHEIKVSQSFLFQVAFISSAFYFNDPFEMNVTF